MAPGHFQSSTQVPKCAGATHLKANCNDISLCIICYKWTSLSTVVSPFLMHYLDLFLLKSWTNQPKWVCFCHWYIPRCYIFRLRRRTVPISIPLTLMCPFDTLPLCNVPASHVAFERGSHISLVVQREIGSATLQQARRCTSIRRKHVQSSWQSTQKSSHRSKPTGNYTHWGKSARHNRATFIFRPSRVLFALHNRRFFLVSFAAIKQWYAVKHTENTAVKHIKSGKGPLW